MATITVRDLDDRVRDGLRVRAAQHGRSMEAEVRSILADAVLTSFDQDRRGLGSRIRARFADIGHAEDLLEAVPARTETQRPIDLPW